MHTIFNTISEVDFDGIHKHWPILTVHDKASNTIRPLGVDPDDIFIETPRMRHKLQAALNRVQHDPELDIQRMEDDRARDEEIAIDESAPGFCASEEDATSLDLLETIEMMLNGRVSDNPKRSLSAQELETLADKIADVQIASRKEMRNTLTPPHNPEYAVNVYYNVEIVYQSGPDGAMDQFDVEHDRLLDDFSVIGEALAKQITAQYDEDKVRELILGHEEPAYVTGAFTLLRKLWLKHDDIDTADAHVKANTDY